jgi:hypothetical protein
MTHAGKAFVAWLERKRRLRRLAAYEAFLAAMSPTDRAAYLESQADSTRDAFAKAQD